MTHQTISMLKSAALILGYTLLMYEPFTGIVVLILAEVVNILGEVAHKQFDSSVVDELDYLIGTN